MTRTVTFLASFGLSLFLWLGLALAEDAYFEAPILNSGLGQPDPRVDRTTPRATLESLYRLAETEDWASAAHLLDLSAIPEGLQREKGAELAQMLKTILDRKVVVDWGQIVDRPDGFDATESSRAATSGMPRRSLKLWEFAIGNVPSAIRLNRIKPDDAPPVWVFSERTVQDIVPLHRAYGPSQFEEWLPRTLRQDAIWGLMWWEFIGVPLLIAIASISGWLVFSVVGRLMRRIRSDYLERLFKAIRTPLVIATVTTALWWGTSTIFVFSGRLDAIISPLVAVGFVSALLILVLNTLEAVLDRLVGFDDIDLTEQQEAEQRTKATRVAALRRVLALAVFLIGAGIVLSSADVFRSLGYSILASAGAITLVLGFAARRVLGNIMASLQIALNQSARIGDRVIFKDHLCHVERINFTFVQLRDWDGTRLVVPVEEFISETFENWTLKEPEMLRILKFKLDPSVDLDALRDAFDHVIGTLDSEQLDDLDKVKVVVTGQDVFGIDVWFYVPCADPNTSWDLACEAREKLIRRMRELEDDSGSRVFPEAAAAEAA